MAKKKRLGEVMINAGMLNETQLSAALQSQKTWGGKLGSTLVRMGFAREEDILKTLSSQLLLPAVDFNKVKISPRSVRALPLRIAEKYNVMPVAVREDGIKKKQLILGMSDPTNLDNISEIEFQTGFRVKPAVATDSSISRAIDYYYRKSDFAGSGDTSRPSTVGLAELGDEETMELIVDHRVGEKVKLESLNAATLLKVLVKALIRKGVISKSDLTSELNRQQR